VIELDGKLATAGWIDLHVHVFEWMTTFATDHHQRERYSW
jgi:predicted amidohydrolase